MAEYAKSYEKDSALRFPLTAGAHSAERVAGIQSAVHVTSGLAKLVAAAGSGLAAMGVWEPSAALLMPVARAIQSLSPGEGTAHVAPD